MYGLHNTHLSVPIQIGLDGPSARDAFFNKDRRTIDYAHLLLHVAHILGSQVPKGNLKSDYSTKIFTVRYGVSRVPLGRYRDRPRRFHGKYVLLSCSAKCAPSDNATLSESCNHKAIAKSRNILGDCWDTSVLQI